MCFHLNTHMVLYEHNVDISSSLENKLLTIKFLFKNGVIKMRIEYWINFVSNFLMMKYIMPDFKPAASIQMICKVPYWWLIVIVIGANGGMPFT